MKSGTAIIIGAGPAGLTAALELVRRSGIKPIILEASHDIGGLSRTIRYKGNRMDIGGHRFFSKSDRVMQWWLDLMPIETAQTGDGLLQYRGQTRPLPGPGAAPGSDQRVMLVRPRKSRIYFLRRFFDYPIRLTAGTLRNIGPGRAFLCGLSYLRASLFPRRAEHTLEDFLINRFGRRLYRMFFESYTEKVWGVPCDRISAEWGAQRIKGLSLRAVAAHYLAKLFASRSADDIGQKQTETSLIEKFLYPLLGPGQLWEHAADLIRAGGGEIRLGQTVDRIHTRDGRIVSLETRGSDGARSVHTGDCFLSTMPVRDLIRAMGDETPQEVRTVSEGLVYRDFITVGLLVKRLVPSERDGSALKDNWIYIQEPDVEVGRLQIFNNWSPALVGDPTKTWIGMEYFCNETDPIWNLSDAEMTALAVEELARIGLVQADDVEDSHVVRVPKTYPAYFGSYDRFPVIREYADSFENLFLIGRNGMHKYNNQDHSMLTAMTAVESIVGGGKTKEDIWAINTEMEYHEGRRGTRATAAAPNAAVSVPAGR